MTAAPHNDRFASHVPAEPGPQKPWLRAALGWGLAWLGVFVAIVALRWEVIDSPPYWDSAMGLFTEAAFLADQNFDYRHLAYDEPRFGQGGAAVYVISLLPTLVAVAMRTTRSPEASFLVCHLASFALGAVLALLVVACLRKRVGLLSAVLVAVALLTTPLVAVQIDMLGMDLPMAVATLAAVVLAGERRVAWALCAALLAFAMKLTGALAAATLFGCAVVGLAFPRHGEPAPRGRLAFQAAGSFALLLAETKLVDWYMGLPHSVADRFQRGWDVARHTLVQAWASCPEHPLLLAALVALAGAALAKVGHEATEDRAAASKRGILPATLAEAIARWPLALAALVLIAGCYVSLLALYTIPRYLLLPTVFAWVGVGSLAFPLIGQRWASALVCLAIAWNVANAHGRWLPALAGHDRTGAVLERSREYLADHRANQEAVRFLAEQGDRPIIVGNPIIYFLAQPRLGYVERPLRGYALHAFRSANFPPVERVLADLPRDPLWVSVNNSFDDTAQAATPQPATGDTILWSDHQASPLVVFAKPRLVDEGDLERRLTFREALFPQTLLEGSVFQLVAAERFAEAEAVLREELESRPSDAGAWHNLGIVHARQRHLVEAIAALRKAVELDPRRGESWDELGAALVDLDRLSEGNEAFLQAARLLPRSGKVRMHQGMLRRKQGDRVGAIALWHEAIELEPQEADAHFHLAMAYDEQGDQKQAAAEYKAALASKPRWVEPANNLAWILATAANSELRDGSTAVAWAESAVAHSPEAHPALLDTLAAAYAEAGSFDRAVITAQRAIDLLQTSGGDSTDLRARLSLYQQARPYHLSQSPPNGQRP